MRVTNLLRNFIKARMDAYPEPTRKGTARGETVGFSKDKYHAALLSALTGLSQKSIAEELVISYGVVRKWHVESEFKDVMSSDFGEFHMFFWSRIRENANEMQQFLDQNVGGGKAPMTTEYDFESDYDYGISVCRTLCRGAQDIRYQIQGNPSATNILYALEALRALSALMDVHSKAYAKKLGRPKSEAPDMAESAFEIGNQSILGTDGSEVDLKPLFERTIRSLETTILNKVVLLLQADKLSASSSGRLAIFILKAIIQDRNRFELTEGRLKKHGSQKTGKKKRIHKPFL
jgi:hypothetical protein